MDASKHDTLGDNVLPENYSLIFEPDLKSFKTMVKERITCRVKQPTKSIKINSKEILISWAEIRSGKSIQTAKVSLSPDDETATFNFKDPVKGKIELWIDAVCTNNEGMYGFYRSRYSANGKDRYILTSQFEAANARAAFPCFDEPSFKATFEVSMLIDKSLDAVSNMPVAGESKADNGKKLVRFKKTLRMSTYLLYLFVGNYDFVKGNLGKLSLRVITVPGKSGLAKLPLENAKSSIKWYQDYFGINLPLQKMDLLAIPDFAAGAMENWGAITFREVALLGNDKTGISTKQFIAEVIAHELTHQWFGDLVTMKWWDDLWLNESFADFMATKPVAQKFPRWETELQYVAEGAGTAFSADSLKSTHPISVHVNRPAEIDSLFDSISYEKGGSVLYMLEDYVGKDIFRKGLNIYLKKHAYSNAEREDLWKAIQAAADMAGKRLEVSSVMQAWVTKVGHPIVEVKKSKNGFVLTQKRFTLLADMEGIWPIPMHYLTESGEHTVLMKRKTIEIEDKGSWIKLNLGQHGFYRARYPKEIMDSLGQMIKSGKLEKIDAWGVESDLFSAVRSGREPIDSYISFVEEYCLDIGYPVDGNVVGHLGWLFSMTYGTKNFQKLKAAILRINGRYLGKLGWAIKKGERESDTMLRGSLISSLGIAGDKRVLARASRLFDDYINKNKEIEVNIRSSIYSLAAWTKGGKLFGRFAQGYKSAKMPDEQRRFLRALAMFSEIPALKKSLAYAYTKNLRLQDSFIIPAILSSNLAGRGLVLPWTKKNWKKLMKLYDPGTHMLGRFIENFGGVSDRKTKAQVKAFFSKKENMREDIEKVFNQTLERIDVNIRFMEKN